MKKAKYSENAAEKRFLSISEACGRYSLGKSTMRAFAEQVKGVRKVGRRVLIDIETVDRALSKEG